MDVQRTVTNKKTNTTNVIAVSINAIFGEICTTASEEVILELTQMPTYFIIGLWLGMFLSQCQ